MYKQSIEIVIEKILNLKKDFVQFWLQINYYCFDISSQGINLSNNFWKNSFFNTKV